MNHQLMFDTRSLLKAGRAVAAAVAGYAIIVALTIAGFNGWLGGANLYAGGPALMLKGLVVAVVAGLAGGYAAALIGGRRPISHAALVLLPLAADSFYVLFILPRENPLWFEALASAGLMSATLAGGLLRQMQLRRATPVPAVT
jgi:hypothetical protein